MSSNAASAPSPPASSSCDEWEDITTRLSDVASNLVRAGELVHHASFSLKESMSALELGDPKMDAASHVPRGVTSIDQALARRLIVPGSDLTLFQQLEIIDELFACEATSYTGSSIAHTVYTCFYLHRLSLIRSSPLLYAYVFLYLKGIELIRAIIIQADIYSEEDFYYNLSQIKIGSNNVPLNFRNGSSTAVAPSTPASSTAAPSSSSPEDGPYAGLSAEEIIVQFKAQEAEIDRKIIELKALPENESLPLTHFTSQSARADSSPLHLYILLKNRFEYRLAWYELNLMLHQQPLMLKANLARVASQESILNKALEVMTTSMNGSCYVEEEAKRKASEDAYNKIVTDAIAAFEKDPSQRPEIPKAPSPHLPPRELGFGFDLNLTRCIVQNSPPRTVSILYRRDAVAYMKELMSHLHIIHSLPVLMSANGTLHQLIDWFERFAALHVNILWRSHLMLYMNHSGNQGDPSKDPCLSLFAFLQDSASKPSSSSAASHDVLTTKELLLKSHGQMCGSMTRYVEEVLAFEADLKKNHKTRPVFDVLKHEMTYSVFLDRMMIPYYSYFKLLLCERSAYRKQCLNTDTHAEVNLILDWNILMNDARRVDGHDWAPKYLQQEFDSVLLPEQMTPQMRSNHPSLYFHHNCYTLVMNQLTHFMSSYLFVGLETSLYTNKEIEIILWYLEYALDLQVQTHRQCYRDPNNLLALKSNASSHSSSKKNIKSKPNKMHLPLELPNNFQAPSFQFCLLEAQQNLARGLVQMMEGFKRFKVNADASLDEKNSAIIVPAIDSDLIDTWFSHRFAALHLIPFPQPLALNSFRSQMKEFDRFEPPAILSTIAQKSFQRAKELLSFINTTYVNAPNPMTVAPANRLNAYEIEYVKSLLKIVVSNTLTLLTVPKQLTQAAEKQKKLRVEFKWEQQQGSSYQSAQSARMMHFPIVSLALER